jgi:hypothetical protein
MFPDMSATPWQARRAMKETLLEYCLALLQFFQQAGERTGVSLGRHLLGRRVDRDK